MARIRIYSVIIALLGISFSCFATPPMAGMYDDASAARDSMNTVIEQQLKLSVSRLLSPNGDGVNDFWRITGIDKYPDNRVIIYNRWGDKVRVISHYDNGSNRWDGNDENNQPVPDGTYYYILEIRKEHKTLNGWVYLIQ